VGPGSFSQQVVKRDMTTLERCGNWMIPWQRPLRSAEASPRPYL